jgi:hypothetical protein
MIAMSKETWRLFADDQGEIEKQLVQVEDLKKIDDHFRGIYRTYLNLWRKTKRYQHMSGWSWKH